MPQSDGEQSPSPSSPPTYASAARSQPSVNKNGMTNDKSEQRKEKKTIYQQKPHILYVGDSVAHTVNFKDVEKYSSTRIRTNKAYS